LGAAFAVLAASPAADKTPTACHLLTRPLVEDYFFTDIVRTSNHPKRCEWNSRISDLHRSASLELVNWHYLPNARSWVNQGCRPRGNQHPKSLRLPGADKACATSGYTGICYDTPTGTQCIWLVDILFRRGSVSGELDTSAEKRYSLNNITRATQLARKVLARWH
jgi:hypothetical protein